MGFVPAAPLRRPASVLSGDVACLLTGVNDPSNRTPRALVAVPYVVLPALWAPYRLKRHRKNQPPHPRQATNEA